MPIDGAPTSSQDRAIPIRKQTITRIAIVFTSPGLSGWAITSAPLTSWTTNVTASPSRNSASRTVPHRTWRSRISDSIDAVMNRSPVTATTTAAGPIFCPGTSANSDTASALVNAVSAADARMRCTCASALARASRSAETEMATNSSPISAAPAPALAAKNSWMFAGTTPRFSQLPG
jgi:hypothetical protein